MYYLLQICYTMILVVSISEANFIGIGNDKCMY